MPYGVEIQILSPAQSRCTLKATPSCTPVPNCPLLISPDFWGANGLDFLLTCFTLSKYTPNSPFLHAFCLFRLKELFRFSIRIVSLGIHASQPIYP